MGFYTKYFSTLFKGLIATSWKERIEARRLIRSLKREDHALYVKIINRVKEHRVTAALTDLNYFIKEVRKSAENAEKLIFNALTLDKQIVKAEKDILDALKELSRKTGKNKVLLDLERELALSIYQGSKDAESEEREEMKQVMLILNEANQHHEYFMRSIRLKFQNEKTQSILTRWTIRAEITRERRDIQALQKIARDIRILTNRIKSETASKKDEELIKKTLEEDYKVLRDALKDAFYESYTIKKRDLLMVLKILLNLNNLRQFLIRWANEHNVPMANVHDLLDAIEKIENSIAKEFQPIAQGFRIIINAVEGIEKGALQEANQ